MKTMPIAIIGAGSSGLSIARALANAQLPFVIYEKHRNTGGLWDIENEGSPMYESAHFISSKTLSGFPDFPMPEDYPDYPTRKQLCTYIQAFAKHFDLEKDIIFNTKIEKAEKYEDGWKLTTTQGESFFHQELICANGTLWQPNIAQYRGTFSGIIRHSNTFKKSTEFLNKRVLVVGGGNSGVDIACEAASFADEAYLSMRRGYYFIPKHVFGVPSDVFSHGGPKLPLKVNQWIFKKLLKIVVGDQTKFGLPKPDHELFESHPLMNSQIMHHTSHGNLGIKPDIDYFDGKKVYFKDGSSIEVDEIILATGYHYAIPFAEEFFDWKDHRPQLYMNLFNPKHDNIYVMGFVETNSAAYDIFTELATLLANYLKDKIESPEKAKIFRNKIISETLDLTGGIKLVASERHTGYVDSDTIKAKLKQIKKQMGWNN